MTEEKHKVLLRQSYIKMIENSVGSSMFNSLYIEDSSGNSKDILNNGEFSCAIFVSSVLMLFNLLSKTRATVDNLYSDLSKSNNFSKIEESDLNPGDIIFWEEIKFENSSNKHVGFYIGNEEAISTSYLKRKISRHHYKNFTGGERKIEYSFRVFLKEN